MGYKFNNDDRDIADQEYKGTGRAASGVGAGGIQGKALMVFSVLGGLIAGSFFHETAGAAVKAVKGFFSATKNSANGVVSFIGSFLTWTLKTAEELANVITEREFVKKHLNKMDSHRVEVAIDSAVTAGALGGLTGLFIGGGDGVRHASMGKEQFETAQEEIRRLRDINQSLRREVRDRDEELARYHVRDEREHRPAPQMISDAPAQDQDAPAAQTPLTQVDASQLLHQQTLSDPQHLAAKA